MMLPYMEEFKLKKFICIAGTLATCCNRSRATLLFGWKYPWEAGIQTLAMKEWRPPQGDPTNQPLYQGDAKPGAGRTRVWGAALQVQPQIKRGQKLGAQGRGFESRRRLFHSFTSKLTVMTTIRVVSPTQPRLRRTSLYCVRIHWCNHCKNVADFAWLELYLYLHFRKI